MASLLHSDSRRLYSWWWDSHISPKNSKWLQENLTDMDTKVKAMIKLIEEDADSFARRAEMYYKKRPELMKLVEEFYRAYRALAERYDHATVELRHAHRTMAEAFPNQLPYELADESPCGSLGLDVEPHTPEMPHPMRAYFDSDDSHMKRSGVFSGESDSGISKRGLKQLNEIFESGTVPQKLKNVEGRMRKDLNESEDGDQRSQEVLSHLSSENQTPKNQVLLESGRGGKAESEVQSLKKMLAEIQAEKEALLLQYKESLKKLSSLARELHEAQTDAGCLDERANKAETEIRRLKEVLAKLESERDAGLLQYNDSLERISILENAISQEQENAKGLNERAFKAEIELENLKLELSVKEAEKEAGLLRYQQCLEMISSLENKISLAEENARMLIQHTARAESEVNMLKEALAKMKEEKDAAALRYEQCLEIIAKMEGEISRAQEDSKRLNNEILEGATKLKSIEENCILLERSNQSLHEEAESLVQKIEIKDQELSEKQKELEKIQTLLKEEQSQFAKVEAALLTLQKLHSQSQEEQRALTLELQSRLQMLKELEISNHALEEDIQQMKAENHNLNELNSSAASSINSLQDELLSLKEIKEKLETEVSVQMDRSNALQKEVNRLEEEIQALNGAYQGIMQQLLSAGLNPEFLESSVKELRDENSKLRDVCDKGRCEKESLYEKLRGMDDLLEKNAALRISLSELSGKLEGSREMVQELQKSCQYHRDEKSTLVAEKATLLSQLQITTGNMQKLLEKNTILENSLSVANAELEGLRTKSKCLEEFCQLLKNEKSDLLSERSNLVSQLENVEQRLSNLEKRFTKLEEKYANLEKEKESTLSQVEELRCSLNVEQHERACYVASSESRLGDLESHVYQLQEEGWSRKKEFEEELDKAVKAQVEIFILQKFIKDLEEKNLSSLIDCQKHVEATKLSDKLIRELESENLEQQIEAEFLLDEIEKLRTGIFQIFRALQFDSDKKLIIEPDHLPLPHIFDNVEDLKASLLENMDEKQQLLVENSVLLTLLQELKLEGTELELDRKVLKQEAETMEEQNVLLQRDRNELLEMNKQLMLEMSAEKQHEEILNAELETQRTQLASMHGAYLQLQEENFKQIEENRILLKKFLDQKEEMSILEEENMAAIQEAVTLSTLFLVLKSFSIEKSTEIEVLAEEIHNLRVINNDLKGKFEKVVGHLENKEVENLCLNGIVKKLKKELHVANDLNEQLNCQVLIQSDFLKQKAIELLDVEQKLKAVHNENADLYVTLEEIKAKCEESKEIRDKLEQRVLELRKDSNEQKGEIERLHQLNENLGSEICVLQKEAGERRIREENLSSELQERSNEFELWEAEAASFYFDFQVSAIGEALLQNKVHELSKVCETLEDEKAAKSTEIGRLKERVDSLENEIGGLKTQLSAYVPVIASLRDSIASLEQNAHLRKKLHLPVSQKETISEVADKMHDKSSISLEGNQDTAITTGVSELLEIQGRLRAVEKAVLEEMDRISRGKSNRVEDSFIETKLKSRSLSYKDTNIKKEELQHGDKVENQKSMKMKPEISEMRNGALMKDIPLDQVSDCSFYGRSRRKNSAAEDHMLELWVSAEQDRSIGLAAKNKQKQERASVDDIIPCPYIQRRSNDLSSGLQAEKELGVDKLEVSKEPKQGARSRKVLERLASDARKLTNLQTNVQDLKKKLDTYKRSKKANKVEHERVMGQLLEVGEAIMELTNINGQLTQDIEEGPAGKNSANLEEVEKNHRKTVTEQAQKTSEKIGRLQFEVQSIQYLLLKLEDECKTKEKSRFSGVLLRDFIYSNRRRSIKRKKARFCGCMRPSTSKD